MILLTIAGFVICVTTGAGMTLGWFAWREDKEAWEVEDNEVMMGLLLAHIVGWILLAVTVVTDV
jgi:hypothetical protein